MPHPVSLPHLNCLRCHHEWIPRAPTVGICPRCKSRYWNSPRSRVATTSSDGLSRGVTGPGLRLVHRHRAAILRIAKAHGASRVRLFGSVARGEDRADSDIDFIVTMDGDRSLLDRAGLLVDLQELLERPVDVVTERSLYPLLLAHVLHEAVPL